ncbi:MAG: PQQ-binding-like beta-propeller repeat protein [Akkermansiaceae bacterium]|nr:PQQ-binding-like beta-propeller repeat protein [Akkermansiaceae bacterium]
MKLPSYLLALSATLALPTHAEDWPMWGKDPSRNMVGNASNLPAEITAGEIDSETEQVDLKTAKNILWASKLGSQTYGNTTIADGRVYVGTNNESPRDPKQEGDRGVMMVFDEKTGDFLWQLIIPKLGAGKVSDWEYVGLCSSACIVDDKAWVITNRGEILCLDTAGQANGNDGPFKDEGKYMTPKGGEPVEVTKQHADILWIYDMREELGIFPHNVSSCSPMVVDGILYTATSNGVDWSHKNIPAPLAPSLVAIDANKGTLVGEEISGVSERVLHASWSSPAYGELDGENRIIWGGGDGFAYTFEPKPVMDKDEGFEILKEAWRYDANPAEYRNKGDQPIKYATYKGPSEIIGTTIVSDNHVYTIIGQDPEHGDGLGMLSCLDSKGKIVWTYKDIGRSISTPSIHDGLIYIAEYDGDLHCLDAKTGKHHWKHETFSRIWGSTLVADGKVFLPTEDGEVHVLATGTTKKELGIYEFDAPIYSSPVVANDVLYIATMTHLYAIGKK